MKVAYFTGIRKIELADRPRPEPRRPDDVLVRIDRVGVCGSDVHYYVDGHIGDQVLSYPATLGHECSGTVIATGPDVRNLQQGDRVAVDPALVCGRCDQCRADRPNTCRNLRFMGNPGEEPGALAEYCVLPAENCTAIPDSMTLDQAVLAEPLSVGLYAVRLAELHPNRAVGILGSGPIGLSVLLAAKAVAPGRMYVTDLIDRRVAAARTCGADWTCNAAVPDVVPQMLAHEPAGLDVVFECSGDPPCIDQAMTLLKPGGLLVIVGIPARQRVDFDVHVMRRKELTFKNVRRQRGCVAPVIELIADRRLDPAPLLTHRFPLSAVQAAFDLVAAYGDGVIKAVIDLDMH